MHPCFTRPESMLYQTRIHALPDQNPCFTRPESMLYRTRIHALPDQNPCFTRPESMLYQTRIHALPDQNPCFTRPESMLYQTRIHALPDQNPCFTGPESMLYQTRIHALPDQNPCFTRPESMLYQTRIHGLTNESCLDPFRLAHHQKQGKAELVGQRFDPPLGKFSVEGIFPLELTWFLKLHSPTNSFGWEYKPRSSLCIHAFHRTDSKDPDGHVLDGWMPATKTHPARTIHEDGIWLP